MGSTRRPPDPRPLPEPAPPDAARPPGRPLTTAAAFLAVAALVAFVHWPVLGSQARALDDNLFIGNNLLVTQPSWNSVWRFFSEVLDPSSIGGYYLPVSMTSLMLDVAMGGRYGDLTVFHRTNLLLHLLTVVVVGLIIHTLFGKRFPAALAALLFGLHPLTVEPIAWVSERKTLLATAFSMLSVLAYLRSLRPSRAWRMGSVGFFLLALLSKPTVTPLPALLLVLDAWPLRRLRWSAVADKWPWLALAAASIAISTVSQFRTAPIVPMENIGAWRPLLQICFLLVFYAGKILWPAHLSNIYEEPSRFELSNPIIAASVAAVCVAAMATLVLARRFPGLLASVLVFLVALSPTFVILSWSHVIAYDRYLYFPAFGIVLGIGAALSAWWGDAGGTAGVRRLLLALCGGVLLFAEARGARMVHANWEDSIALWSNAVAVSPTECDAHHALGLALEEQGRYDEAERQYRTVLQQVPTYIFSLSSLGILQARQGRFTEACSTMARASEIAPRDAGIAHQWGLAEKGAGRLDAAEAQFHRALELDPGHVASLDHLGTLMVMKGEVEAGVGLIRRAMSLEPANAHPHFTLGIVLLTTGAPIDQAMNQLRRANLLSPDWVQPLNTLAWIAATSPDPAVRNGAEAVRLAVRARNSSGRPDATILDTHAAALAANGEFERAVEVAGMAIAEGELAGDHVTIAAIRARLERYRRRVPYVDSTLRR